MTPLCSLLAISSNYAGYILNSRELSLEQEAIKRATPTVEIIPEEIASKICIHIHLHTTELCNHLEERAFGLVQPIWNLLSGSG